MVVAKIDRSAGDNAREKSMELAFDVDLLMEFIVDFTVYALTYKHFLVNLKSLVYRRLP